MEQRFLIVVLLGLAAAFMPLQFGYEVFLFGRKGGKIQAATFTAGITFFRVLLLFAIGLFFSNLTSGLIDAVFAVARFFESALAIVGREAVSGERILLDLLLLISGIFLLLESYLYYRRSKADVAEEEIAEETDQQRSSRSIFLLGFGWVAISINQWLFTLTAINQIVIITRGASGQVLLSLLFLLLASLMILLPFLVALLSPQRTNEVLARLSTLINETLVYVIIALMVAGGLYLAWIGARGLGSLI